MKQINNIDILKQALNDFKFNEFRIIRDFHFYDDRDDQKIDITLESEDRNPNYLLKIRFSGVSGLRVDNFGGGETRIVGFDIENISSSGWEGIAWKIFDFENDSIQFFARDVSITSVDPCIL